MLNLHMPHAPLALLGLAIFVVAMILVMIEEHIALRKSKPVVFAAGILWLLVAISAQHVPAHTITDTIQGYLEEYVQLFLFLFVAIVYINAMEERNIFNALRGWLTQKQFTFRQLFWITGVAAFFISPIADNMTTALILCAIVLAIGKNHPRFISLACINIVVAANAGGAFSPFGDITTLMVWQKGVLAFKDFFHLFIPALVNFLIPATCMHFAVARTKTAPLDEKITIAPGGLTIVCLFLLTIATTTWFNHSYHIPPAVGMMTGLAYLQLFSYSLKRRKAPTYDIFAQIQRLEWDTLLFFYGVMLCIGALGTFGYLELASSWLYASPDSHTMANLIIGVLSAIIDNIPLMFAVLTMDPLMSQGQWLLLTLTTGVGGSLLSIGSAAGVALMGQSKGYYTFLSHLRWSWAIFLGYAGAVIAHLIINRSTF